MWRHLVAKFTNARISKKKLLTKLASYKVPLVMVSTHGSVVPLAMFPFHRPDQDLSDSIYSYPDYHTVACCLGVCYLLGLVLFYRNCKNGPDEAKAEP